LLLSGGLSTAARLDGGSVSLRHEIRTGGIFRDYRGLFIQELRSQSGKLTPNTAEGVSCRVTQGLSVSCDLSPF
jgi:hypothetical protein